MSAQRARPSARRRAWLLFRLVLAVSLLWWVVRRAELDGVRAVLTRADARPLLGVLALGPLLFLLRVTRWSVLLRAQGSAVRFGRLLRYSLIGGLLNSVLPSTIGGDVARAFGSLREGVSRQRALTVIVVDRFLGLSALLAFAVAVLGVSFTSGWPPRVVVAAVLALAGAAALGAALLFAPPMALLQLRGRLLQPIAEGALAFRGRRQALAQAFFVSLALQALLVLNCYLLAAATGAGLSLRDFFVMVPLASVAIAVPVSIGGIGVREGAWTLLFTLHGSDATHALAFTALYYAALLVHALVGAVAYAVPVRDIAEAAPVRTLPG